MDIHTTLAKLTRHPIFKEWHEKNKEYYLAHAFVMLDEANKNCVQVGFYNPEKERMVTFFVSDDVQKTDEQEVLRSEGTIQPLRPEEVKLTIEEALQIAEKCFKEYKEIAIKHFFIIQNTEGHTMFNITYFTQSLKTVNIKIDANSGKIIKHSVQNLAQFS
ncbi:MAG: PepSY domain-containing protein [Candidatus Woesearchaeota archaeon]|nr:PepSY domain-containing protein [Candidatus Woesearchaeota archaeon]